MWYMFLSILGISWTQPKGVREATEGWSSWKVERAIKKVWKMIPACIFWCLWQERNRRCFDGISTSIHALKAKCLVQLFSWSSLTPVNNMGGRSEPSNEIFCQFIFPEKPGPLRKFLDAFSPRWNISLFHYREQGELDASVLVGFQVPKGEIEEFRGQANKLGYSYEIESLNEASQLMME